MAQWSVRISQSQDFEEVEIFGSFALSPGENVAVQWEDTFDPSEISAAMAKARAAIIEKFGEV